MNRTRGTVLKSGKGWAIIMTELGSYKKIKTSQPLYVGQYYDTQPRPIGRYALAAAVLLFFLMGTIDFFSVVAYAEITPGIELGMNRWQRVVTVYTTTEEGKAIRAGVSVTGREAEDVVADLVSHALEMKNGSLLESGELTLKVRNKDHQNIQFQEEVLVKLNSSIETTLQLKGFCKSKEESTNQQIKMKITPGQLKKETAQNAGAGKPSENSSAVPDNAQNKSDNGKDSGTNASDNARGSGVNLVNPSTGGEPPGQVLEKKTENSGSQDTSNQEVSDPSETQDKKVKPVNPKSAINQGKAGEKTITDQEE